MSKSAGKGDSRRPENGERFRKNFTKIKGFKSDKAVVKKALQKLKDR